jgi:hypothetical protein
MPIPASNVPIGVYRTTGFWRIFGFAISAAMTIGGIVAVIYTWIGTGSGIAPNKGIFTVFAAGDVAMGIYIGVLLLMGRITLYSDAIENRGVWTQNRLVKADIACKLLASMGAPTIILIPKSRRGRKMAVSITFAPDQTFNEWMEEIPLPSKAIMATRHRQKSR